jgi:saccharopine dehydrogenase-like NADP-dependent oxidoreductase
MKIALLGCGLVGGFIGAELIRGNRHEVFLYDNSKDNKLPEIKDRIEISDLSDPQQVAKISSPVDLVVNALPGHLGFQALKIALENDCHVVDFSFMPEDFRALDSLAIKHNKTALVDFGFAPGLCHMLVAHQQRMLPRADSSVIWVGGLPQDEADEYKAVFSPMDVIEEYTRVARFKKEGKICTEDPFMTKYKNEYPAFISDGLRSLLDFPIENIVEYTYRYEKHFNKIKKLKLAGEFKPGKLEKTAKKLINDWKMPKDYKDLSVLSVETIKGDRTVIHRVVDKATDKHHSMARMTGIPVLAGIEIINREELGSGIIVPEHISFAAYRIVVSILEDYDIKIEAKMIRR